jgi:hypothetical protein
LEAVASANAHIVGIFNSSQSPSKRTLSGTLDYSAVPNRLAVADTTSTMGVPPPTSCVTTKYRSLGNNSATVGQTYASVSGGTQHFIYTSCASSSLGIGVSSTPNSGFSESGSNSTSSSGSEDYGVLGFGTGSWTYQTYFVTNEYKITCDFGGLQVY